MYFEAESNGVKYEVNVTENRRQWNIAIKADKEDWVYYEIAKEDYQALGDTISFLFRNSSYLVDVVGSGTEYTVFTRGSYRSVKIYNEESILHESLKGRSAIGGADSLNSGMPGKIVSVLVKDGEQVKEGQPLLIMEAMKMENEMRASHDVTVKSVNVSAGDNVEAGTTLIEFE